jgi:hypothetical protein
MKKTILLFALVALLLNPLAAGGIDISLELTQTPYKWGGKNGNRFEYIIGETSDEYLALRGTYAFYSYDYKIARYEKSTMNLLEVKPLFPKDYIKKGGFKPTYSWGINQYKEHIYFLFGYKDQSKDNISVYYQKMNDDGSMDGSPDKLLEAPFIKGSAGWFGGTYSYDSTKFLSVYEVPTKNKERQQYSFHVYNIEGMSLEFEKDVELPYLDKDVNLIRYDVDNEGNVYGLVQIYEKREKGSKETDNYTYKIYGYTKESGEAIEYDFDIPNKYINSLIFQVKNGIIYVSGFWGKKNSSDISGVYSLRLDAVSGEELVQDVYEFSDEFIEEFYSDKEVDKADKKGKELEVKTIVLDYFKIQNDGSAYVVGEQHYTYTVCYYTGNGTRCVTYYVHNDIVVTKIDPNGVILWSAKIPKKSQLQNATGHLSYHLFQKGDDLYFIYYDNQENFDLDDPKKYARVPYFTKKMDLVCTRINSDGEKEKVLIYNYGDPTWNQLRLSPNEFQNINGSEILGQGFVKGKKEVLGRFTVR